MARRYSGPSLLTRAQVAEILGVSVRTVDRYLAAGTLPSVKTGVRSVRIPAADLDALLVAQEG